ncbi:MAG: hypothetical protein ACT4O1_18215 [Gemmatimonadota bacterium]
MRIQADWIRRRRAAALSGRYFELAASAGIQGLGAIFTRADAASYIANISDTVLDYAVGDSLAPATMTRGSTATYVGNV